MWISCGSHVDLMWILYLVGQEERRKMREEAILAAKSFLNPENKPHPSQAAQQQSQMSTPAAATPSAAAAPAGNTAGAPQASAAGSTGNADRVS